MMKVSPRVEMSMYLWGMFLAGMMVGSVITLWIWSP